MNDPQGGHQGQSGSSSERLGDGAIDFSTYSPEPVNERGRRIGAGVAVE